MIKIHSNSDVAQRFTLEMRPAKDIHPNLTDGKIHLCHLQPRLCVSVLSGGVSASQLCARPPLFRDVRPVTGTDGGQVPRLVAVLLYELEAKTTGCKQRLPGARNKGVKKQADYTES